MGNIAHLHFIGAACWASYLINGDASGLSDDERQLADAWCERELGPDDAIVDCGEPYFTNHYSPEDTRREVKNLVLAFGVKYKDDKGQPKVPDALAALAYDATNILLTAIKNAGADDSFKVKETFGKMGFFNAVSGRIMFDKSHNPVKSATILAIKDGKVKFNSVVNP